MATGKTLQQIQMGESASITKTLTETDVYLYAGITMDQNPAHVNQAEMEQGRFGGRIVHGMLTAGLISAVLGMHLPGPGTIYVGQELSFTAPVKFGDTITATATAEEVVKDKFLRLKTVCTNQKGETVIEGYATVMPPRAAKA